MPLGRDLRVSDLPLKDHERLFRERVPLTARGARAGSRSPTRGTSASWPRRSRPGASAMMQERGTFMDRREVAPALVRGGVRAGLGDAARRRADRARRDGDRRLHARGRRALPLLRTHEWSDEVLDDLRHADPRRAGASGSRRGGGGAGD